MKGAWMALGAALLCLSLLLTFRPSGAPSRSSGTIPVTVVQGGPQLSEPRALPTSVPMAPVSQETDRRAVLTETVKRTLETDYPMIRHADVACDRDGCVLTATLNDISSEEQADTFDRLMNGNMGVILARNGFHPAGQPVIEMMGGIYTGFSIKLTRDSRL